MLIICYLPNLFFFLASIDVDKVAREIDVDAIQENIVSVTYCNIEHELVTILMII